MYSWRHCSNINVWYWHCVNIWTAAYLIHILSVSAHTHSLMIIIIQNLSIYWCSNRKQIKSIWTGVHSELLWWPFQLVTTWVFIYSDAAWTQKHLCEVFFFYFPIWSQQGVNKANTNLGSPVFATVCAVCKYLFWSSVQIDNNLDKQILIYVLTLPPIKAWCSVHLQHLQGNHGIGSNLQQRNQWQQFELI